MIGLGAAFGVGGGLWIRHNVMSTASPPSRSSDRDAQQYPRVATPDVRPTAKASHGPGAIVATVPKQPSVGAGGPGSDPYEAELAEVRDQHVLWGRQFTQAFPGDAAVAALVEYYDALTQELIDLNGSLKREGVTDARQRARRLSGSARDLAAPERKRANQLAREYFNGKTALKVTIDRWWTDSEPPVQPFLRELRGKSQ